MTQSKVIKKVEEAPICHDFPCVIFLSFDMNNHKSKQGRECFILTEFDLRFVNFWSIK